MKPDQPILKLRIDNPTRVEKRKAKREYEHFLSQIEPIEIDFCNEIMKESIEPYKDIYNRYLLRLNQIVEYLNDKKYKIIEVDTHFFEKNYKPLEE